MDVRWILCEKMKVFPHSYANAILLFWHDGQKLTVWYFFILPKCHVDCGEIELVDGGCWFSVGLCFSVGYGRGFVGMMFRKMDVLCDENDW